LYLTDSRQETSEVRGYAFRDGAINYTLIDTPGFDDTFLSDDDVTKKIVEWLDSSYRSGVRLNGLIYMHSIALPKMQGSAFQNLRMFRKLCGSDALKNVILATTFWDQVEPLTGQERERVLIEDPRFWGRMVQFGSRVLRTGSSRESALHILRQTAGNQKITLQVQQETVVIPEHRRLSYQIAPSFNTAANPGRTQWYLDNMMKREAESKKWSADLESLKRHALDQSLILEKVREDAEKERVRIEQQREERRKIYKSNRCHCKIVGRASCASCGRELSKVGKVFYRKLSFRIESGS
jgi:hypothetical protein